MSIARVVPANSRGGSVLLHDDYRYVRNWKNRNKQVWRCTQAGCGAYVHTNLFDVAADNATINGMFRNLQAIFYSFLQYIVKVIIILLKAPWRQYGDNRCNLVAILCVS